MEKLHDLLKSAYLNLDGYSIAKAIQIHGGLYWLFREASVSGYSDQDGNPSDVRNYEALCKRNLETCLNSLDLLLPATDENVIALFIGVSLCTLMVQFLMDFRLCMPSSLRNLLFVGP